MATLYTKNQLAVFTMYEEMFDDYLQSGQQANPPIVNVADYYLNRIKLRTAINDAKNSITLMSSISNAQAACDRGTSLISRQDLFF